MPSDSEDLDLSALADEADVTPRTIRYYIQQGLLPAPDKRGLGARYDRGLIDRLSLIKLLQRQHLPLAEIRRKLEDLDDDGVRAALGAPPELSLSEPAVSYVRSVLRGAPSRKTPNKGRKAAPEQQALFAMPAAKVYATRSTWERVRLSHDVEVHIRRPLSREHIKLVDRLLDAAKTIFSEES